MSEAVAPSRAMRSRANRRESSVARGIELDSPSLKSTDLAGLYHVERPRETWCRNFARNLVSRDRASLSQIRSKCENETALRCVVAGLTHPTKRPPGPDQPFSPRDT